MATLTWKDNRLDATDVAPFDTTVMLVSRTTPIKELIADSANWFSNASGDLNLMIYCHGAPGYLQLAKEGMDARNVNTMSSLKPYVSTISIHACSVAKGQVGRHFCRQLARVTYAWVDAATALQGNTGRQMIFGWEDDRKYDGDYYRHLPSGEVKGPLRSS